MSDEQVKVLADICAELRKIRILMECEYCEQHFQTRGQVEAAYDSGGWIQFSSEQMCQRADV